MTLSKNWNSFPGAQLLEQAHTVPDAIKEKLQEHMNHLTRHLNGFCQLMTKVCLDFFNTKNILLLLLEALLKSGKSFSGQISGLRSAQDSLPMRFQ